MTFTKDSFIAKFWLKQVREGNQNKDNVPTLFNLREIVFDVLDEQ